MAEAGPTPYRDDEDLADQLPAQPSHSLQSRGFQLYTLMIVLSLLFLLDIGGTISDAPAIRILESILCYDYYKNVDPSRIGNDGTVKEEYCKIDQVQELLAYLNGWDTFFANLPGMMSESNREQVIRLTVGIDRAVFGNSLWYGSR